MKQKPGQVIVFHIAALVRRWLLGLAPAYLQGLCYPTLGTRGCSFHRSMERGEVAYSLSLLSVLQPARLVHSRWLTPLLGMGFHWNCDCSRGFTLTHSTP